MYEVDVYENRQGRQPVKEVLLGLKEKAATSKDARIQYKKILYPHVGNVWHKGRRAGSQAHSG